MTVTIAMPQLGLTMTEATVGAWLKKPGDTVRKDEPVLSISTDKVDMDVESNVDGVLRDILVEEGQHRACGNRIGAARCSGQRSCGDNGPRPLHRLRRRPLLFCPTTALSPHGCSREFG